MEKIFRESVGTRPMASGTLAPEKPKPKQRLNPKTVWHEATHFQQAILKAMAQNGNKEAKKILTQFDKLMIR